MNVSKHTLWAFTAVVLATLACSLTQGGAEVAESDEIVVTVNSPANNSQVAVGQEVQVQITINDPAGVVNRQELLVDGTVVASADGVAPTGAPAFSIIIPYTPTAPGTYQVTAIAYGSDGSSSQVASFTLIVTGESTGDETQDTSGDTSGDTQPDPQPTATVNPTPVPDVRGCTNDMRYVRDVTIPDGTEMDPGQAFTKTWEIRNSGTCDWGGYRLVYHSDEQMGGPDTITVPATSAGQTVQVSVNLTAPATPDTYFSRWTMRSADGDNFGNVIFAKIVVKAAAPPPSTDGPDLIVTNNVSTNPTEPEAGAVTTYTVEVKNQGNEDADASTLRVEFEGGSATTAVPAIAAGATESVSVPGTTPTKGVYEATFTADNDDDVDETDETNNSLSFDITYVSIYKSGTFSVRGTFRGDLDEGQESAGTTDFFWEMNTATDRYLTPDNGATFAVMGSSAVGFDECSTAALSGSQINASDPAYSDMPAGTWICAETSDGRYSAFKVDAIDTLDNHKMTISYTTYE
jgi:hypothetical protein